MDLHLEHVNGFLKEQLKNLRINLDKNNATRVSRASNALQKLVQQKSKAQEQSTHRKKSPTENDVGRLAMEMKNTQAF